MMQYERCVRKKLRSLFEYLDADRDGRISQDCLLRGINSLQNHMSQPAALPSGGSSLRDADSADTFAPIGEYEVEELLRCVPESDEDGTITLQAFLDSEATILPRLSKLRLLQ